MRWIPPIGAKIYAWVRYNKRVMRAEKGAEILLANQMSAIEKLKASGITVKINSIIIPGINDHHIPAVAEHVGGMGVDILNCVPYYPNKGSAFEDLEEPSREMVKQIRDESGKYVKQMRHCTRCRADAVGLLGETPSMALMDTLKSCEQLTETPAARKMSSGRTRVAVASMEGVLVNQHLGEAAKLLIYGKRDGIVSLIEARETTPQRRRLHAMVAAGGRLERLRDPCSSAASARPPDRPSSRAGSTSWRSRGSSTTPSGPCSTARASSTSSSET